MLNYFKFLTRNTLRSFKTETVLKNSFGKQLIRRSFYVQPQLYHKLHLDTENNFAFQVLSKNGNIILHDPSSVSLNETQEVEDFLNQNWRKSNGANIVQAFLSVKDYCIKNDINLSSTLFNNLVDGLMDHCTELSANELEILLECLGQYPDSPSYTSHNFHDLWSCLDDICCDKLCTWDIETSLRIASLWYKWKMGRLTDYSFEITNKWVKKADNLTPKQLVQVFFFFNVCRRRKVDFEYESALEKYISQLTIDEMGVVAMGYFKTQSKVKIWQILQEMVKKVIEEKEVIHEVTLASIAKIIRFSKPHQIATEINIMMDNLLNEMDRFSNQTNLHLAIIGTSLHIPHEKSIIKASKLLVNQINDPTKVRLKDIERLLNALTMFNIDPKLDKNIYEIAMKELHKKNRQEEIDKYQRCLPCSLHFLSLRNMYSHELLDRILDMEFINSVYGKSVKLLPREIFSLDCSAEIECPNYTGRRLPITQRYRATKWLIDYTPTIDQWKKYTPVEKFFFDVITTVQDIVKDNRLLKIEHVLPHYTRADLILCKNKTTGELVEPKGLEKYVLGDIMYASKDLNYDWIAIVVHAWNSTVKSSSEPLGLALMKERQLVTIGYKPVRITSHEFFDLTPDQKRQHIIDKLSRI